MFRRFFNSGAKRAGERFVPFFRFSAALLRLRTTFCEDRPAWERCALIFNPLNLAKPDSDRSTCMIALFSENYCLGFVDERIGKGGFEVDLCASQTRIDGR